MILTTTGRKVRFLKEKGWYRSISGHMVDPHMACSLSNREIRKMPWDKIKKLPFA